MIERLAASLGLDEAGEECRSWVGRRGELLLCRPLTFMNRSGWALRCLAERHGFLPGDALVVYDDVALPLGRLRARARGGPGGHRGMESVIENLRTEEIARLRLGVGPAEGEVPPGDLSDFVLAPFAADEIGVVGDLIERAAAAAELWLEQGIEAVMNRCNA